MILLKGSQDVLVPLGVAKIRLVDDTVGYLLGELERAGLLAAMNVLVVSDHGTAVQNNTMYLSDVVDETLIDRARSVINVVSSIYVSGRMQILSHLYFYDLFKKINKLIEFSSTEFVSKWHSYHASWE